MKLRNQLLALNVKWCQSCLTIDQFASFHGMTVQEMDKILIMVQSWEESNEIRRN
jgi:hypothetical protein